MINDKGIYFRQSEYGFKYSNEVVFWKDILEFGVYAIPGSPPSYYIIIGTKSLEIFKIDVTGMEFSPEEYVGIINKKLKKESRTGDN